MDTYESILALVRAGLGYSLLPFYPGSDKKGSVISGNGIPPLLLACIIKE